MSASSFAVAQGTDPRGHYEGAQSGSSNGAPPSQRNDNDPGERTGAGSGNGMNR